MIDSQQWSEGALTRRFEAPWAARHGLGAVATGSWTGAALAALDHAGVGRGDVVLCPSNTFMATPLAALHLGAEVEFVDCERDDLCLSLADLERAIARAPAAGGVRRAHRRPPRVPDRGDRRAVPRRGRLPARGLRARARRDACTAASRARWGDAGAYSFYATKTVSTGEGGMLVSRDADLLEHARALPQLRQARPRRRRA